MINENTGSKKLALGLVFGVAVGATALYLYGVTQRHKQSVLHKLGETMCEIGGILESCEKGGCSAPFQEAKKNDFFPSLFSWVSNGISLWKKLVKGE